MTLTTIEQEQVYTWLAQGTDGSPTEQENAMSWLTSIGSGAAQGAATGAVAGPWGALIGGIVGAGLGALQQATQQSTQPSSSPPPRSAPPPPPRPAPPAPPRPTPAPSPPSAGPPPRPAPAGGTGGTAAVQQIAQVLPQLLQLVQTIQPVLTSLQSLQSSRRAGEDINGSESLAGDQLPDSAFGRENVTESAPEEDHIEYAQPTEAEEPAPASGLPPSLSMPLTAPAPAWLLSGQSRSYDFAYPGEWSDEAESLALLPGQHSAFQWTLI